MPKEVRFSSSMEVSWRADLGKCIDASPLLTETSGGRPVVVVGSHSGAVVAVDPEEGGKELWRANLPDRVEGSAAVTGDGSGVMLGCYDGKLYCLSLADGRAAWSFQTAAAVKCTPAVAELEGGVECAVFGSYDRHLYCVGTADGGLRWKSDLGSAVLAGPEGLLRGHLLVCTLNGTVIRIRASDGQESWRFNAGAPVFSSPASSGALVFLATAKGDVFCLGADSGDVVWKVPDISGSAKGVFSTLVVLQSKK